MEVTSVALASAPYLLRFPRFDAPLTAGVREARLLTQAPWVRSLGKLEMTVQTEGWKFPSPPPELDRPPRPLAEKAVKQRFPDAGLVAHSDRGSRKGDCYDHAPMESFFASLKKELVHHENDPTRDAAKASLFESIEVFYNRMRRHSSLGYVAPAEFECSENS